jgi:hypothetical protein
MSCLLLLLAGNASRVAGLPLDNPPPVPIGHGVSYLLLGLKASTAVPMAALYVQADGEIDDVHGNLLFFSAASRAAMRSSNFDHVVFFPQKANGAFLL